MRFTHDRQLLLELLVRSDRSADLSPRQWSSLLCYARNARLLSKLAIIQRATTGFAGLDPRVAGRLRLACAEADRNRGMLQVELRHLRRTLSGISVPLIATKGSAYLLAGHTAGEGRLCGDIDLLVPPERIQDVYQALVDGGYQVLESNRFNQRYYDDWMHELSPLGRPGSAVVIDLHHSLIPRTDRLWFPADRLIEQAVPLAETPFQTLSPPHLLLHSAIHLFRNGRFELGLRDLFDMHQLIEQFSGERFWHTLAEDAESLRLTRPLSAALHYVGELFGTAMPSGVAAQARGWQYGKMTRAVLDRLVKRAMFAEYLHQTTQREAAARYVLRHWPLPRLKAICSPYFWLRKLPHHFWLRKLPHQPPASLPSQ